MRAPPLDLAGSNCAVTTRSSFPPRNVKHRNRRRIPRSLDRGRAELRLGRIHLRWRFDTSLAFDFDVVHDRLGRVRGELPPEPKPKSFQLHKIFIITKQFYLQDSLFANNSFGFDYIFRIRHLHIMQICCMSCRLNLKQLSFQQRKIVKNQSVLTCSIPSTSIGSSSGSANCSS